MLLPDAVGGYSPRLLSLLGVCRRFFLCLFRLFRAQVRAPSGSGLPARWLRSAPVAGEVCPFPVPGPAVPVRLSRGPPARGFFPLYYIIRCTPFPFLHSSRLLFLLSNRCITVSSICHSKKLSKKSLHCFAVIREGCTFAPAFGNGGGDV